jgi:hypothetical protein
MHQELFALARLVLGEIVTLRRRSNILDVDEV